ncbi:hypothetical protein [Polyangium aurulentum]|uniref:hypothetical protein n=1 Tax=Polyangium aurulentum TaxID=2567896 RepID=UPI0010ADDD7E|nr:hypothetical protein [Polyangium aurulentum]UQA56598.1 hypothetical protein E8A73_035605 [Polyangium aurulentum]
MAKLRLGPGPRARAGLAPIALTFVIAGSGIGCGGPDDPPDPPRQNPSLQEPLLPSPRKIDLLLAIDNSRAMADKQALLALAVPDLVNGLVNPRCVDESGSPAATQPGSPLEPCPAGTGREAEPVLDVHIGVITSSIGGHGADACPDVDPNSNGCAQGSNKTNNDKGHLVARVEPCGGLVATWNAKQFLAWDPAQELSPPGEDVIDDGAGNGIVPRLREMVLGTGEIGCGYESQMESWYRFLVDPEPYESIAVLDSKAMPMGTDAVLLQQRAEFLRSDSLLAIVMLTDENDCSIKEYGQFYYVGLQRIGATDVRMPRARSECTTKGPNDPCCKSCGQNAAECGPDPTCKDAQGNTALLSAEEDDVNLRCWDQKRRFGIDFLYPTDRYTKALTSLSIQDRNGNLVPNPLFSDLKPGDGISIIRDESHVFLAGIVGVPWQDIARDETDLGKGFKSAEELGQPLDASGVTTWDVILGDPAADVKPKDPLMIESVDKRTGKNPITGDVLVDASSPTPNPINGHERTIANDDLQYACVFDLLPDQKRDCTDPSRTSCDCTKVPNDDPLCTHAPNTSDPTLQVKAKAYPSLRELSVLRGMGEQGIVASVCPASTADPASADFGYRPAMGAILERVKTALVQRCLPRVLSTDSEGKVPCFALEAQNTGGGACVCDPAKGRGPLGPEHEAARKAALADPRASQAGWNCFCEIVQLGAGALDACQKQVADPPLVGGQPVAGFCYIDATATPPLGNPEIVKMCPEDEKRLLRFVGEGKPAVNATLFVSCTEE